MGTEKQQFNSPACDAMVHLRGRGQPLAPWGWTGRRAGWTALGCVQRWALTRRQWARFLSAHPKQVRRGVHA